MSNNQDDVVKIASAQLGKKAGDYSDFVDITEVRPDFLVPIPRRLNRVDIGVRDDALPFVGFDTWHGYEVSALTENGYPVSGMVKLAYPSDSECMVESKSMKLFWNSFNMVKLGKTVDDVIKNLEVIGSEHLSRAAGAHVDVKFFRYEPKITSARQWQDEFIMIEALVDVNTIKFDTYTDDPSLVKGVEKPGMQRIRTNVLRSNCRVTHQPDFGDIFIHIAGHKTVDPASILQYIVSMRKESHFHEEIVERVYTVLLNVLEPDELMVTALYTRRGGWDICPARATAPNLLPQPLGMVLDYDNKTLRQ